MKQKLLITGGLGYIGSHTVIEFEKAGYKTVIVDNLSNSKLEVLGNIEKILGYKPKFYKVDLLDKSGLEKVFQENEFDDVLHFAGLKAVGESCQKPIAYFQNNIAGSLNLFEIMDKYGVKNMIFSSSATVYDVENLPNDSIEKIGNDIILKRGLKETDPAGNTTNPYGKTKCLLEEILKDLAKFSGFNVVSLRYFNPIGAHSSGLLGEAPNGIPNNLMPYIMKVLTGQLEKLKVFGGNYPTKDGTGVRDYIDVVDLVKGHLKAWEWMKSEEIGKEGRFEVFNLGVGMGLSVLDMIEIVEEIAGKKIPYKIIERRDGDLAKSYCNPDKSNKILGWKSEIDIEDSIKNMLKFYKII